jgi:hypothetical protein
MKKIILFLLFILFAATAGLSFAANWKKIEKIEVEVFTAEQTAWTVEYSLGRGIYRKISGLGRKTLPLNLKDLDTSDNDIMCSILIEVDSFPTRDALIGMALRIFRSGNIVEQLTGPACRTNRYSIEYWLKKYK